MSTSDDHSTRMNNWRGMKSFIGRRGRGNATCEEEATAKHSFTELQQWLPRAL